MIATKKICICCGKEFIGYHTQKYCSIRCRNFYATYGMPFPDSGLRICEECGKEYYYQHAQENWRSGNRKNKRDTGKSAVRFCSHACGKKFSQRKFEDSILKKYNVSNISKLDFVKKKKQDTCLKNFNVINPMYSEVLKSKNLRNRELKKEIALEKCKNTWKNKTKAQIEEINNKRRNTCLQKYGVETVFETDKLKHDIKIQNKRIISKKINHTFTSSKPEKEILAALKSKFEIVEYQYKSIEYPFTCDFYIPKLNLYIEYQGHWTHGLKPFENTKSDQNKLKIWKEKAKTSAFYKGAINVWTNKDPLKRSTAKKNNLYWIEFFKIQDFYHWFNIF